MSTEPFDKLDTFENPAPERDYTIQIRFPEFTCLCPLTGQPDFAEFLLEYVADELCLELKGLKLYMVSYRDTGAFHEDVTNKILGDFVRRIDPRFMRLTGKFNVRGGIYTTVIVEHRKPGWSLPTRVILPGSLD